MTNFENLLKLADEAADEGVKVLGAGCHMSTNDAKAIWLACRQSALVAMRKLVAEMQEDLRNET